VAAPPRPYGVGRYGTGAYSRYSGEVFIVGGACDLAFTVVARGVQRSLPLQARSAITWSVWAPLRLAHTFLGRSSISWSVRCLGVTRITQPQAASSITWSVWASHSALSWAVYAPCVPGAWGGSDPCLAGAWSPPAGPANGSWNGVRLPAP